MGGEIDVKSIRNHVCDVEIKETGTENCIKSHAKGTKMVSKSLRNQSCEADTFWDRFWRPKAAKSKLFGPSFGTLFAPKSNKYNLKRHQQINVK